MKHHHQKFNRETYAGRTCGLTSCGSFWCPSCWCNAVGLVVGPTSLSRAHLIFWRICMTSETLSFLMVASTLGLVGIFKSTDLGWAGSIISSVFCFSNRLRTACNCSATRLTLSPWTEERLDDTSLAPEGSLVAVDNCSRPEGSPRPRFRLDSLALTPEWFHKYCHVSRWLTWFRFWNISEETAAMAT